MSHITRGSRSNRDAWEYKEQYGHYPWEDPFDDYKMDPIMPKKKKVTGLKKVCKQCGFWTKKKHHGKYKCYTNRCPAKQRDKGI